VINGAMVKPSITRGVCPAYGITRDRLAATGSLLGGGNFSALKRKRFAQLLIRIAGGIWSGLLNGTTLLSGGHGTNRPGSCYSECDYGNAIPHDTSCIPQELRKGSNNSKAIAIVAFGDGQTFVCRLSGGRSDQGRSD